MSEQDRSRLYAWLCDHADEPIAEYMMSRLPNASLSDLVTKEHLETVLSAEFSKFALTIADQRKADREYVDRRFEQVDKRFERIERQLRRLAFALPVEIVMAIAAVAAVTEWLRG